MGRCFYEVAVNRYAAVRHLDVAVGVAGLDPSQR
jgi:hypothetical protein